MNHLRPAIVLIVLFTLLTGVALPFGFVGFGSAVAPSLAAGSLVGPDGAPVGSALIGQAFTQDKYFQGRPSATTDTDPNDSTKTIPAPYKADNSGASNMAATSQALIDRVKAGVAAAGPAPIPADALTSSASGLDPHISPETAQRQVARVAAARALSPAQVQAAVDARTQGRLLGLIGEPRVNVLLLNMDLDALTKTEAHPS